MRRALSVAAYRTRVTLARQWGTYLALVVLIGLLGGLSIGALAAARSTESSMTQLARSENVPDLYILDGYYNPSVGLESGYNPGLLRTIRRLPHVRDVQSQVGLSVGPVTLSGTITPASLNLTSYGSVDGLDFSQNRVFITQGRMANPRNANEFVTDAATAKLLGLHVGQTGNFGWITDVQSLTLTGSTIVPKSQRFRAKLVGIGTAPFMNLFQDQSSPLSSQTLYFTPALTRRLRQCCANDMISGIQLKGGSRYDATVEAELRRVLPKGVPFTVVEASAQEVTAQRTLRPDTIALDVFGGIAALALLLIVGQIVVRRASSRVRDLAVLRALGASRTMIAADDLLGTLGAVLLGALVAAAVAVGVSPLTPLGPVQPYVPTALHFDWSILGAGFVVIIVALATLAVTAALRWAPHRDLTRVNKLRPATSGWLTRNSLTNTLPISAVTGIRFVLEPGSGRNKVPVRSATLGAALAMIVVTGNLTFGASMASLVSHPALYGWTWNYLLDGGGASAISPNTRLPNSSMPTPW